MAEPRFITAAEVEGVVIPEGGTTNQVLAKNSDENFDLKWKTSSGTPGGSDTQVQFNDGEAFGGDAALLFDKATKVFALRNSVGGYCDMHIDYPDATGGSAVRINTEAQGDAELLNALFIRTSPDWSGAKTVVTNRTLWIASADSGSTVTVNEGILISDQHGVAATNYALHITDQGTGANDYAIYVEGGKCVFLGGIKGTATNDSAALGNVGEEIESSKDNAHTVSLTNNTAANVTSISLTAGDWDVEGNVNFTETTSTVTARTAGISATSATLPTDGSEAYCGVQSTLTSETNSITLPRKRISTATTTSIYLVAKAVFSAGTCAGFGTITARRVR